MSTKTLAGVEINVDEEGYMTEFKQWSKEIGAEIAKEDADKVIDAIRTTKKFYETDAFLLIASAGGGTGSGSLPVMVQHVKERYSDKPVYAAVVLPFE